jgi:hypothetical protein
VDEVLLGPNHAELFHLGEDVDDSPGLRDAAVDETEDEDLVVGDGGAGWWVLRMEMVGNSRRC